MKFLNGFVIVVLCVYSGWSTTELLKRSAPDPVACFGRRSQANAERAAREFIRTRQPGPMWTRGFIQNATISCHPRLRPDDRWSECNLIEPGPDHMSYVYDCDTAEFNNVGCRP